MTEKMNNVWVMVEAVSTYRVRYLVEAPADHLEYALDTVSMREAKEFSQEHLGELVSVHCGTMNEAEALADCRVVNDYCASWTDEQVKKAFFTSRADQEKKDV